MGVKVSEFLTLSGTGTRQWAVIKYFDAIGAAKE